MVCIRASPARWHRCCYFAGNEDDPVIEENENSAAMNELLSSGTELLDGASARSVSASHLAQATKVPKGPFRCRVHLPIGSAYEIQASTDLETWSVVTRNTASDESVEFIDAQASAQPARFYRAVVGGVASCNVVGYAGTVAPQGFAMISNPFANDDNTVATLFPRVPENTTLCKFDTRLARLTNNSFKNGKWSFGGERLDPGEGAIFFNPTFEPIHLDFAGTVQQGELVNQLGAGFSIRGSMLPKAGKVCVELGLPVQDGDVIHVFDRKEQRYQVLKFPMRNWHSAQPSLGLCEGFWLGKANAGKWVQKLELPAAIGTGARRPV